jgi:hypothetical protein
MGLSHKSFGGIPRQGVFSREADFIDFALQNQ